MSIIALYIRECRIFPSSLPLPYCLLENPINKGYTLNTSYVKGSMLGSIQGSMV